MKIHDISVPLEPGLEPWPGDRPFRLEVTARIAEGASVNLSAIGGSVHNGTHVDAPHHVEEGAPRAGALPLGAFLGPAVVLDSPAAFELAGSRVSRAVPRGSRVLLRSGRRDFRRFPERWPAVPPAWIEELAAREVPLLGTDAPSLDPPESRTLAAHRACVAAGIQILENLVLTDVESGSYELMALPLRVVGADAAPVRAVLVER